MFSSAVSTLLRRSVVAPRSLFPSVASSSSSSSSLPLLFSSLSLQPPPGRLQVRTLSTSPALATPRPGLLRKKHLGRQPHQARRTEPKTHSGAKARFKSYKNGTFKHVKAGSNQLKRKDNVLKRGASSVMIFTGRSQTAKLKRLMPYWRKTRRNGGW